MKRKMLSLILCAFMICEPFTAYADEVETETNNQIMFRGIPWGSSFTDVQEVLDDPELMYESSMSWSSATVDDVLLDECDDEKHFDFDISAIAYSPWNSELEVAGYTTTSYSLFFGYTVEDGNVLRDEDSMQLYAGKYFFESSDFDAMSQDLIGKLNSLYGEYSETRDGSDPFGYDCKYAIWYDDNGGAVSINMSCGTFDGELAEIEVTYAWLDGDELLDAAYEAESNSAASDEAEIYGNGSTDGL